LLQKEKDICTTEEYCIHRGLGLQIFGKSADETVREEITFVEKSNFAGAFLIPKRISKNYQIVLK